DELARQARIIGLLEQRLARALARDIGGVRENRFEVAVGLEQLRGGLVADALHPGNVVGGVADEREEIDDARGWDAEALAGIVLIDPLLFDGGLPAAPRVEQRDAIADQ